eukprot:652804-Pyramimonas_sp.AAC.1
MGNSLGVLRVWIPPCSPQHPHGSPQRPPGSPYPVWRSRTLASCTVLIGESASFLFYGSSVPAPTFPTARVISEARTTEECATGCGLGPL